MQPLHPLTLCIYLVNGKFFHKLSLAVILLRHPTNNVRVAFIPHNKFNELKISANPECLKYYKTDTASIERLYCWGSMYNGLGECAKALTYLEKAEKINPKYKVLAVELSFSYNCLKQYDNVELILEEEIKNNSSNTYVNKEYIFAW